MHIQFVYGLWASAAGDGHGLRGFQERIHTKLPDITLGVTEWKDPNLFKKTNEGWRKQGPLVLIGHSFGGGKCVEMATWFGSTPIRQLFLLDPVPPSTIGFADKTNFVIPSNVKDATCWKRSALSTPIGIVWSCPIRNQNQYYINITVDEDHNKIPSDPHIQEWMLWCVERIYTETKLENLMVRGGISGRLRKHARRGGH